MGRNNYIYIERRMSSSLELTRLPSGCPLLFKSFSLFFFLYSLACSFTLPSIYKSIYMDIYTSSKSGDNKICDNQLNDVDKRRARGETLWANEQAPSVTLYRISPSPPPAVLHDCYHCIFQQIFYSSKYLYFEKCNWNIDRDDCKFWISRIVQQE